MLRLVATWKRKINNLISITPLKTIWQNKEEFLAINPGKENELIHWDDLPKYKTTKASRKFLDQFKVVDDFSVPPRVMRNVARLAKIKARAIFLKPDQPKKEDYDNLGLRGKYIISSDGFVTKIIAVNYIASKKLCRLHTAFGKFYLTDSQPCLLARFYKEDDPDKMNMITSRKIAFFVLFFLSGDLMGTFKVVYSKEYNQLEADKRRIKWIYKYLINPETLRVIREKIMIDKDFEDILKKNGASKEDAIKAIADIMKSEIVEPKDRLDAAKTILRINGVEVDKAKIDNQQNNLFLPGSVPDQKSLPPPGAIEAEVVGSKIGK